MQWVRAVVLVLQGSDDAVTVVMLDNNYCMSCFRCKVLLPVSVCLCLCPSVCLSVHDLKWVYWKLFYKLIN